MEVLITGGGGFIGYRLARTLAARGTLADANGAQAKIGRMTLCDTAFPTHVDASFRLVEGDLSDAAVLARALSPDTAAVFHLAAVVSAGAEADFDLGMRINLDATRQLLDACRKLSRPPRLVFASSVAAFGGALPETLDDSTTPKPQTSYGTQKVIGEYLVSDYTRKGFVDGRSLRLPTIVVRPGKPNLAASSFASAIIREPLNGLPYDCPVDPQRTAVWLLSPARVVEDFIHAHDLPASAWGADRVLNLPGITVTVKEMLAALARIAGPTVAARVLYRPEPRIETIVGSWPVNFRTERATRLGFQADPDIDAVIRAYIRDENIAL